MWTDGNGAFYEGDMRPGDRTATAAEIATWRSSLPKPTLSFDDFCALFSTTELSAIFGSSDPKVRQLTLKSAATGVNLSKPSVQGGIAYLSQQGLIAPARVAQVQAGQPAPIGVSS